MTQTNPHTLIVGGTKGIGLALARKLAAQGLTVTLSGRTEAGVQAVLARLQQEFPAAKLKGLVLDLHEREAAAKSLGQVGAVDHLVLCGSSDAAWGPFNSLSMAALERALQTKLIGYLNALQAVLPQLAEHASITLVGGAAARAAMPGTVGLAAVNGGLMAATRTLARELAPRRVNLVSPGLTDTEAYDGMPAAAKAAMFSGAAAKLPVQRTGTPQDIAEALCLAMNNPLITGTVLDVDGGAHLG